MINFKLLAAGLSKSRQVGGDEKSLIAGPILYNKPNKNPSSASAVWGIPGRF